MSTVVSFDHVGKVFGTEQALINQTFHIKEKSFTALIGNNGCGKSTTLNILCNVIGYDAGNVEVFGQRLTPQYVSYKTRMGIFLSADYLVQALTIKEYLQFVCKFQGVGRSEAERRIKDVVEFFELGSELQKQIKDLSAGNRVKVGLCGAMVHNPELLILDEPFANLDILTVSKLCEVLATLRGKKTLVVTSHSLEPVAELCDHYLVMDKGRVSHQVHKDDFESNAALVESIKSVLTVRNTVSTLGWLG